MLVFVYGTLKRGFPNHGGLMDKAKFFAEATSAKSYPLFIAGRWNSPVLQNSAGEGHRICGELFQVSPDLLQALDYFEGTEQPDGYYRQTIAVRYLDPKTHSRVTGEAEIYFKKSAAIQDISAGPLSEFPTVNTYVPPQRRPEEREA